MRAAMIIASGQLRSNSSHLVRDVWPSVVLIAGTALTCAWIALLGYGLVTLIERAL